MEAEGGGGTGRRSFFSTRIRTPELIGVLPP